MVLVAVEEMGDDCNTLVSSPSPSRDVAPALELNFPSCHPLVAAHYHLHIPAVPLFEHAEQVIATRYRLATQQQQRSSMDVGTQIASYADQVKEMKGRINWLQESLRRSSGAAAQEHTENLGKFFAVQSVKVEELGQQIDVFSEELRQWEEAENPTDDNRLSSLARTVIQEATRDRAAGQTVRIQLSDLVQQREQRRDQSPCLSISRNDLEMKRKAMGARVARAAKHEAKRRKVQEVKFPFKVGIPAATRPQGGVRTGQLRRSNKSILNGTAAGVQGCINSLQREVLRLKEIVEDRDQQLCAEQRQRYDLEKRHAVEVRAFLMEAEDRTRQFKFEQALAENKISNLLAELERPRVVEVEHAQEQHKAALDADNNIEVVVEQPDDAKGADDPDAVVEAVQKRRQQQQQEDDEVPVASTQDQMDTDNVNRQVPVTSGPVACSSRFYGREIAINGTQLRQALKLKSIAEAKAENLKRQVNALKKLAGELQHEQQQHSRHRRESGSSDVERLQAQLLQLKKQLADKTRELEAEQSKRSDEARERAAAVARLEIEQSYDAISHKQNRRLQLSLKKSRHKYEQLHDFWRKEQGCRLSSDSRCHRLHVLCSTTAERLDELKDLLVELEAQQRPREQAKWHACSHQDMPDLRFSRLDGPGTMGEDSKLETSEKLLFLLDKLAKGLDDEQQQQQHGGGESAGEREALVSGMRKKVSDLARLLRDELQDRDSGDEAEQQEQQQGLTAEQQLAQLGRVCELQGKKLRAAEGRVAVLKKHVSRLRRVADETSKELEHERSWNQPQHQSSRNNSSSSLARIKLLEIQLLEYKRQAEDKAKDLKHERSLRFDLESRSATHIQHLLQQLDEHDVERQDVCVQVQEEDPVEAMHVFVLELLVGEKSEALAHERRERGEAEARNRELATLLSYAQVEIANANQRDDELCQVSACQGHKVVELTALLERFAKRLDECEGDKGVSCVPSVRQSDPDDAGMSTSTWNSGASDECVKLTASMLTLEEDKGGMLVVEQEQHPHAAATKLRSCEDFIANLKKQVKDLELSEEVLRYRDKVWRRGLLAFDQVLLLCFGALFAFNRITILLRDKVPT
ncbi:hypothetical protein SELMODRAFT_428564 [Selaginella moellendorffii]|uniref:Uncharacterized protein n=1 Tax=Selaginella moellendorffii TaxID=88036 RepID=D8T395_SELML|nr:hypothetical protein SELMODRAFT_428564 [Selaginella moellendorffii]